MRDDYSNDDNQLLTSNAHGDCAWLQLLVASCSLPLRTPRGSALCVTLLDERKEELHVFVSHDVARWRRVAAPGSWCCVARLLPAPFQHNARVWRTCAESRVRRCPSQRLRAHLQPRSWQEQHSRLRAGCFRVERRLRSGDLVLRALPDGAPVLLVTHFSARLASLPRVPPGALVSLRGAASCGRQGVLAMCARTDLRVLREPLPLPSDGAAPNEGSNACRTPNGAQRSERSGDTRFPSAVLDGAECAEQPAKAARLFDSPILYRQPRNPARPRLAAPTEEPTDGFEWLANAEYEDEEVEDAGSLFDVEARNFAQYLWYLETLCEFRARFSVSGGGVDLEPAVTTLIRFLDPSIGAQECADAASADCTPLESSHDLPDSVLSDCFSDDHSCPLVGGVGIADPIQFHLSDQYDDLRASKPDCACVSEPLRNVVGILELSANTGCWLLRQPRVQSSFNPRTNLPSSQTDINPASPLSSTLFDSGYLSQQNTPSATDSDYESQKNTQVLDDSDFKSRTIAQILIDSDYLSQQSFEASIESANSNHDSFPLNPIVDSTNDGKRVEAFTALVMNTDSLDACMNGRLVLLPECRLVAERGTTNTPEATTTAGLWLDSQVQDLAAWDGGTAYLTQAAPHPSPSCPLCESAPGTAGAEQCDERWDPEVGPEPGLAEGPAVDLGFVELSLATRHRFVLLAIGALTQGTDGQRSCLLLVSLLRSFNQVDGGTTAVLSLRPPLLRWLPLLRPRSGYALRGCTRRLPHVAGLPAMQPHPRCGLERHDCAHGWPSQLPADLRSYRAHLLAISEQPPSNEAAGCATDFAADAWLEVCAESEASDGAASTEVLRVYLRGWAPRVRPRGLLRGATLRITCVRRCLSAAGRAYLQPTPLTDIKVVSLPNGQAAWWTPPLPSLALPTATVGVLPAQCIRWARIAARCTNCSAPKRGPECDRCGSVAPGRARATLRLCAAPAATLVAVDDRAADILGYNPAAWKALLTQVSLEGRSLEWAGRDEELPEDWSTPAWVRRFYAACRTQPLAPLAARCRTFTARPDQHHDHVRFVLEVNRTP